jgi:hypothetical protein
MVAMVAGCFGITSNYLGVDLGRHDSSTIMRPDDATYDMQRTMAESERSTEGDSISRGFNATFEREEVD